MARSPFTCQTYDDELHLSGAIDETAHLVPLVERARAGRLVLDLGEVTFINSIGVREWIRMQTTAAKIDVRIELRRVAEPIVHQLNIVVATRGVSIVTSFYAPYQCDSCERDELVLLDVTVHGSALAKLQPPAIACPGCKKPMIFAEPPELYLAFLTS